jgi:ribose 5-phosphate isomerase B
MRLAIASDHAGVKLKGLIVNHLAGRRGLEVQDLGAYDEAPSDYPDYAAKVARSLLSGASDRGILVCGSGVGMSVAANKFPGVRAAVIDSLETARQSRAHVDANVAVFGERQIDASLALPALDVWLETDFEGGRHERRVGKIREIEREVCGRADAKQSDS